MITFGSVCSGIEAASFAFPYKQLWCSEISEFPSNVLNHYHPNVPNIGDMSNIPDMILNRVIESPDILCGGTPCNSFSLAGLKQGLLDDRGLLSLKFIEIANAIDTVKSDNSIILWENVEGILNDKNNAFGNFIAALAGFDNEIVVSKWAKSGYLEGVTRNVAWRVLDAKYFGVPQQRKRLFVLAGGKQFRPDSILFEQGVVSHLNQDADKIFYKNGIKLEIFREYTDCLYAAYGTKWNGNAAAYNGSLYVSQDDRLRRFTPLECERLMGFPDNYTLIDGSSDTNRYKAIGNSWAIPVIKWITNRFDIKQEIIYETISENNLNAKLYLFDNKFSSNVLFNTSPSPNNPIISTLESILETDILDKFYLSKKACQGILRRKDELNINMNNRLKYIMNTLTTSYI